VGGDWFDAIPLSGTRIGLVVGEVPGHGLRAAATMGRLRTAVRVLARLDLTPDELLFRLDDMVRHSVWEAAAKRRTPGTADRRPADEAALGVSCLFAVYDPVSGRCTMARAGHPMAALLRPEDAVAACAELPAGPPLGVGGLPYESAELQIPPGSLVALFTDGLLQSVEGPDKGLGLLAENLAQFRRPLEELCDRAIAALLPGPANDDTTLLLARTRMLAEDQVSAWELPADPARVGDARNATTEQLSTWGLDDLAFTTELIVSELVTNAIRYAAGPVHIRLIRDQALICEVSDTGYTSPHLRHAETDDEGGRGLFIIAQMAQRWGTRYTATGKTIWVEQDLPSC
jgi:anti-sigma regulatory factor (Ser/Thr protein kinase)